MFKRKEAKKPSPGDFVMIGENKIKEITQGAQYKHSSFNKDHHGRYVSGHRLTNDVYNKYCNNQLSPVDAGVLYYKRDSIFGSDIAEVIPVVFLGENYDQTAIEKYIRRKRTFLVNKKDIDIMPTKNMVETVRSVGARRTENSFEQLEAVGILTREDVGTKIDDVIRAAKAI